MNNRYSRHGDFKLGFIDLLLAVLGVLSIMILMAFAAMAIQKKENEGIRKNADFIITAEWSKDLDCDIDLWVKDPMNNTVSYRQTEAGLMYFERDDMGHRRSVFEVNGQEMIIDPDNKEYVTLRGTFPGEYIVNLHVYSCMNKATGMAMTPIQAMEVPVNVEVVKVNPTLYVSRRVEVVMENVWQEKTAMRFTMDDRKNASNWKMDYVPVRTEGKTP